MFGVLYIAINDNMDTARSDTFSHLEFNTVLVRKWKGESAVFTIAERPTGRCLSI